MTPARTEDVKMASEQVYTALALATAAYPGHDRKYTAEPCLVHPLAVRQLVRDAGGTDAMQAALGSTGQRNTVLATITVRNGNDGLATGGDDAGGQGDGVEALARRPLDERDRAAPRNRSYLEPRPATAARLVRSSSARASC